MKNSNIKETIKLNENETHEFGIELKADGLKSNHETYSKIYNPVNAAFEHIDNSIDATVPYGIKGDIEFTYAKSAENVIIKDNGVGLGNTKEKIQECFDLSESSKKNNDKAIGTYNIGLRASGYMFNDAIKRPFGTNVCIDSCSDGKEVKITYTCRKGQEDIDSHMTGYIFDTDKPNGTTVTIDGASFEDSDKEGHLSLKYPKSYEYLQTVAGLRYYTLLNDDKIKLSFNGTPIKGYDRMYRDTILGYGGIETDNLKTFGECISQSKPVFFKKIVTHEGFEAEVTGMLFDEIKQEDFTGLDAVNKFKKSKQTTTECSGIALEYQGIRLGIGSKDSWKHIFGSGAHSTKYRLRYNVNFTKADDMCELRRVITSPIKYEDPIYLIDCNNPKYKPFFNKIIKVIKDSVKVYQKSKPKSKGTNRNGYMQELKETFDAGSRLFSNSKFSNELETLAKNNGVLNDYKLYVERKKHLYNTAFKKEIEDAKNLNIAIDLYSKKKTNKFIAETLGRSSKYVSKLLKTASLREEQEKTLF